MSEIQGREREKDTKRETGRDKGERERDRWGGQKRERQRDREEGERKREKLCIHRPGPHAALTTAGSRREAGGTGREGGYSTFHDF